MHYKHSKGEQIFQKSMFMKNEIHHKEQLRKYEKERTQIIRVVNMRSNTIAIASAWAKCTRKGRVLETGIRVK